MKTLYLDLFSGISGDMFVGALLDLGVDAGRLELELRKLPVEGYHVHVRRGQKQNIAGVKFDVHLEEHHHPHDHGPGGHHHPHDHAHAHGHDHETLTSEAPEHSHGGHGRSIHGDVHDHEHRSFSDIRKLIESSPLSEWVRQKAVAVFTRVAVAEGRIHGLPPEQVEFHEVGAVDSIVDIVGACVALDLLGRPTVMASTVTEGTGWVECAHGRFPVPAPATLGILADRGIPVSQCEEPSELVTPTGAALLAEFAESFGPLREFAAEKIGFGLGTRENRTRPNVLRAILGGATQGVGHDWERDDVTVIETNLDDVSAEVLGHVMELALAKGALDVFHTPIQMKKNRPGVLLTVLCHESEADRFSELLLRETTAFGVRRYVAERRKLKRAFRQVTTEFGEITVKTGILDGQVIQAAPEYESCRQAAERCTVPVKTVYVAALKAASLEPSTASPA